VFNALLNIVFFVAQFFLVFTLLLFILVDLYQVFWAKALPSRSRSFSLKPSAWSTLAPIVRQNLVMVCVQSNSLYKSKLCKD